MARSTLPAPHDATLSDDRLATLRAMLEEQREFRIEQLAQLHGPGPRRPLSSSDPEILRSLVTGARAALHEVSAALWRMADGTYGSCVACGHPIGVERLEILPQAATCLRCQAASA